MINNKNVVNVYYFKMSMIEMSRTLLRMKLYVMLLNLLIITYFFKITKNKILFSNNKIVNK